MPVPLPRRATGCYSWHVTGYKMRKIVIVFSSWFNESNTANAILVQRYIPSVYKYKGSFGTYYFILFSRNKMK
jgi:hypothetical protein